MGHEVTAELVEQATNTKAGVLVDRPGEGVLVLTRPEVADEDRVLATRAELAEAVGTAPVDDPAGALAHVAAVLNATRVDPDTPDRPDGLPVRLVSPNLLRAAARRLLGRHVALTLGDGNVLEGELVGFEAGTGHGVVVAGREWAYAPGTGLTSTDVALGRAYRTGRVA